MGKAAGTDGRHEGLGGVEGMRMKLRGDAARGVLSLLLFAVWVILVVGPWAVLTLAVGTMFGKVAGAVFGATSAFCAVLAYALVKSAE